MSAVALASFSSRCDLHPAGSPFVKLRFFSPKPSANFCSPTNSFVNLGRPLIRVHGIVQKEREEKKALSYLILVQQLSGKGLAILYALGDRYLVSSRGCSFFLAEAFSVASSQ